MKTIETSQHHRPGLVTAHRAPPIIWWATLGGFCLVIQIYAYTRWVTGPYFERVDPGPDPIPLSFRIAAHSAEVLAISAALFGLYRFVYRPLRERRRLAPIGMMWASAITIYWLDWSVNWAAPVGNWTGAFWFNMGSWYNYIPGWVSPNGHNVAELNSFGIPVAILWFGLGSMLMASLMRRAKYWWPNLGTGGLIAVAIGAAFCLDIIVEVALLRVGLYTYSGGIPWLNVFDGHYYQFPVYEAILAAPVWVMSGAVLYFIDDKGRTWVERGIDRVTLSPKKVGFLRFCAFSGFLNLIMIGYTLGWIFVTIQPGFQWTGDVVGKRSYLIQGLCGPGTDVACPAEGVPLPRGDGNIRIDPEGNLVRGGKVIDTVELRYN